MLKPEDLAMDLTQQEAATGAFLGACVGDAAGAVLEGLYAIPSESEVQWALGMPGGGCWRVAPGQCTDDSELAISLAWALAERSKFDLQAVAAQYVRWVDSDPFDIGHTTASSLGCAEAYPGAADPAAAMQTAATRDCMGSKANGSLMRSVALGIWGWNLEDDELAEYARLDSSLSHPNSSSCDAVACYVLAVASLIRSPGERAAALHTAHQWADRHACDEVKGWLELSQTNEDIPGHPQAGFIKIAFVHAFRHLRMGSGYEESIRATLAIGGDTDTNACIVGGLIGASRGADDIPESLRKAVLGCDTSRGRPRPDWLHPKHLPQLVEKLITARSRY